MELMKKNVILEFIEQYRNLPALWDISNCDYRNRNKKAEGYNILAEILRKIDPSATRETVVKKINALRSNFRKELRKINESKQSGRIEDEYVTNLWYFKEFLFLTDMEMSDSTKMDTEEENFMLHEIKYEADNFEEEQKSLPSTSYDEERRSLSATTSYLRRKRSSNFISDESFPNISKNLEMDDDEFLLTAKVYAMKLKKMAPTQRIFADRLINEVLAEGQLGQLTSYSYIGSMLTSRHSVASQSPA